jgi:hypothetical protein
MNFRRIIATATVIGALAALPITLISSSNLDAGGVAGASKVVSTQGGQGGWPLFR